jgi:hypothetical protein
MIDFFLEIAGKSTRVGLHGLPAAQQRKTVKYATGAGEVHSVRMITGINKNLVSSFAELRSGDPELNLALAGTPIGSDETSPAYYDPSSDAPRQIGDFTETEIVYDANDVEKLRRPRTRRKPNLNDAHPIKVTKRIPLVEALTSFAPKQTLQVVHVDGLSFEFLRDFAADLAAKQEVAMLGAGAKGNQPIVLRNAGTPYRGFLVSAAATTDSYQLLMVLSDQELKLPEAAKPAGDAT